MVTREMFKKWLDAERIKISEEIDKDHDVWLVVCVIGPYELVLKGTIDYEEFCQLKNNKEKIADLLYEQYSTREKAIENFIWGDYYDKIISLLVEE